MVQVVRWMVQPISAGQRVISKFGPLLLVHLCKTAGQKGWSTGPCTTYSSAMLSALLSVRDARPQANDLNPADELGKRGD